MNRYVKISLCLLLFLFLGSAFILLSLTSDAESQSKHEQEQTTDNQIEDTFVRANRKAQAAKNNNPETIKELCAEVINGFAPLDIPSSTRDAMIERVVRAELDHRQHTRKGVSEHDVVKTVNELAGKFGLPEYAKTRNDQVRSLRVQLMPELSYLIAQDTIDNESAGRRVIGYKISRYMSPIESVAVTLLLIQQKISNDEYQVTPNEFAANRYRKKLARWQALKNGSGIPEDSYHGKPKLLAVEPNTKKAEVERAIYNSTTVNLSTLADKSLDTLGIKQ